MARVTGIDIGSSCIHLVEVDGSSRKYRVTRALSYPRARTEDATGDLEEPADPRVLTDELKAALQEAGVTRDRTLLAVRGAKCILRNITLPFRGRDEIRKVLKFEAESYIHSHAIDDVVVDALLVQERAEGTELFMAACPKDALGAELRALHKAGVEPEIADLSCTLLVDAAREAGALATTQPPDDAAVPVSDVDLILDIGASSIQMVLARGGQLWTARVLRWGLDRLEQDMAERMSVTPEEMRVALDEYYYGAPAGADDADGEVAVATSPIRVQQHDLEEASRTLATRIMREVTRFLSGFNLGIGLGRVLLTGGGSRVPGLPDAVGASLDAEVALLDLIGRTGAGDGGDPDLDLAFAAALAALGATRPTMNLRQEELAFRPKFDRLKLPLAISLLTGAILLLFLGITKGKHIARYDRQIGVAQAPKSQGRRVSTRGKRNPEYSGLLLQIAHPIKRNSFLLSWLQPVDAKPIMDALPDKPVRERTKLIVRELTKLKKDLEKQTGYFPEVELESGLAVLQAFSSAVDKADKDPGVGRFVIPTVHLQVGTSSRNAGFLKFLVSYRGEDYRQFKDSFERAMQSVVGPDGAFESLKQDGPEKVYRSTLNPGAEYPYRYELNAQIKVFQPKNPRPN